MTPDASLSTALLVGVGGTLGALARFAVDTRFGGRRGVFAVNVLGSVALGALGAAPVDSAFLLVFGTGFCGAFTTFSSFAVGVVEHAQAGERRVAARYALGTLAAALVGVALGGGAVRALL
ncbi:camphor resistance protein CrcB [Salinigranum rubrum]|uniref:Fluoride-specific ion channel FluC n=1 Tax=Salinigranum rubrum TaxID=755307 RepID=A0A2I8VFB9_9EURY|nr:CrcB family protein [Salinigranum rubrum]AUV80601.1 camphor resistance protein CrcB [Salinigranum rubrum]